MKHCIMGLQLLEKCNFECSHCVTKCTNKSDKFLTQEEIEKAIQGTVKMNINKICITGGEPLLEINKCIQSIQSAVKNRLEPSLVSNGFWGKNSAEKIIRLLSLAGLKKLALSYDSYHSPFVNCQSIVNIVNTAKDYSIPVTILYCYDYQSTPEQEPEYREITSSCGMSGVALKTTMILPLGRAIQLFPDRKSFIFDEISEHRCETVSRPILLPGGNIYACCGPAVESKKQSPLLLGNIYEESVFELLEKGASNIILNAIFTLGIKKVLSMLPKNMQNDIMSQAFSASQCSICRAMTDDIDIVSELYSILEPMRYKILAMASMISKQNEDGDL